MKYESAPRLLAVHGSYVRNVWTTPVSVWATETDRRSIFPRESFPSVFVNECASAGGPVSPAIAIVIAPITSSGLTDRRRRLHLIVVASIRAERYIRVALRNKSPGASEVPGRPGSGGPAEQPVGARDAPVGPLLDLTGRRQLPEARPAQIGGTEDVHGPGEVGLGVRPRAGARAVLHDQLVPAPVGRAERILDLEHDPAAPVVATCRQRGGDIDEPDPQAVVHAESEPSWFARDEEEGLVRRAVPRLHGGHEIHVEEVSPDVGVPLRVRGHALQHLDRPRRDGAGPVVLHRVDGVGIRLAFLGAMDRVEPRLVLHVLRRLGEPEVAKDVAPLDTPHPQRRVVDP